MHNTYDEKAYKNHDMNAKIIESERNKQNLDLFTRICFSNSEFVIDHYKDSLNVCKITIHGKIRQIYLYLKYFKRIGGM